MLKRFRGWLKSRFTGAVIKCAENDFKIKAIIIAWWILWWILFIEVNSGPALIR